jgi:hypothetical protein
MKFPPVSFPPNQSEKHKVSVNFSGRVFLAQRSKLANNPRQSPTICPSCTSFPVFGSPTATVEVVGNTGKLSSEKPNVAGVGAEFLINYIQRTLAKCY